MHRIISLLLLVVMSGHAQAEWEKVISSHNSSAYIDRASIRGSDDNVAMQVLIDYQKPPFDGNNLPYLSLTMRNEYHCGNRQFRVLQITSHASHMGLGAQPYKTDEPSEWEAVPNTSIQKALWEIACGKNKSAQSGVKTKSAQRH